MVQPHTSVHNNTNNDTTSDTFESSVCNSTTVFGTTDVGVVESDVEARSSVFGEMHTLPRARAPAELEDEEASLVGTSE
jgi:predicted RNA-binding protein with PIN domain